MGETTISDLEHEEERESPGSDLVDEGRREDGQVESRTYDIGPRPNEVGRTNRIS